MDVSLKAGASHAPRGRRARRHVSRQAVRVPGSAWSRGSAGRSWLQGSLQDGGLRPSEPTYAAEAADTSPRPRARQAPPVLTGPRWHFHSGPGPRPGFNS